MRKLPKNTSQERMQRVRFGVSFRHGPPLRFNFVHCPRPPSANSKLPLVPLAPARFPLRTEPHRSAIASSVPLREDVDQG
jgi:hypothetical protein